MGLANLGDDIVVTAGDDVSLGITDLKSGAYLELARLALRPSVNELCRALDRTIYIAAYYGNSGMPIAVGRITLPPMPELLAEVRTEQDRVAPLRYGHSLSAGSRGVLYIMACGMPAARDVGVLVELAQRDGWEVCVFATPEGRKFVDAPALQRQTGHPVRSDRDSDSLPAADAMIVAPATINTINKWAAGITDTFVLELLSQAYGYGIPIVAVPYPDKIASLHPRFQNSLEELRTWGVKVLYGDDVAVLGAPGQEDNFLSSFPWRRALQALSVRSE